MRKLVLSLALVGMIAAPALADLTPSAYTNPQAANLQYAGGHSVGVYAPGTSPGIYLDFKTAATTSDYGAVTFAFHWPYATPVSVVQMWSSLVWDNSEIAIVNTSVAGPFTVSNYWGPTTWASAGNPSSGTLVLGDVLGTGIPLWCNPEGSVHTGLSGGQPFTKYVVEGSGIYPFMVVDFHVKGVNPDSYLDLLIGSAALLFRFSSASTGLWWSGGEIGAPTYGMGIIPEPASLSLLGLGLVSVGAGVWRRRR